MITETVVNYAKHPAFIYQVTTTLAVYYLILIARFYIVRLRRYKLFDYYGIPGPKPSIWDGHTSIFYKDQKIFEVCAKFHESYGPTWVSFNGDFPGITTSDPALLRHVFLQNTEVFSERTRPFMDIKIAEGILFCPRPKWKFFRRILATPFNRFTIRGRASVQFIEDSVQKMMRYIEHRIKSENGEKKRVDIDIYSLMKSNALYIISELAIKLPINVQENEPNVTALDEYLGRTDGFMFRLTLRIPWLKQIITMLVDTLQVDTYMSVIYNSLQKRIDSSKAKCDNELELKVTEPPEEEPVLDMLIRSMHRNHITKRELFGNAEALLFAGYDTTSTTLIYTLWLLAKHQDIQERLKDELSHQGTESKYLTQVLNESMRLFPVVTSFATRLATKSTVFNGIVIPEETLVIYNQWIMHRNPIYWEKPLEFNPERFAEGNKIDPIYFAPFGLGERKCLGAKLAMLQMKMILTELVLRYKLILLSPKELDLVSCGFVLTKPAEQIKIELQKRNLDENESVE